MPLNFTENEKPREPVEFFVVNTKARPLDLEGEVLPELIRRCGDVKSGCITAAMVEAYLDKNVLVFDRAMVRSLFQEADFRKQGFLDGRSLAAALSARYPRRQLHHEWRQLAALLMGMPELVLANDIKCPKYFDGATLRQESVWDSPAKELPKVNRRRRKPKAKSEPGDWNATTKALQDGTSAGKHQDGTIRTAEGVKDTTSLAGVEHGVNALGLSASRSTFAAQKEFERLQKSQELEAAFASAANSMAAGMLTEQSVMQASSKRSIRSWAASLPPTAITVPGSALHTLRTSVRSTLPVKPEFVARHHPLTAAETDLKRSLGAPMDLTLSLNRVEPVRSTNVPPQASYVEWADYASRGCRTAPSAWFNEHPAAPAPPASHRWC